jgi:hypothetical protein
MHTSYEDLHARLYPRAAAKAEYILCAAIYFDNGVRYEHQPKNIESGIVICGRRHHNCFVTWSLLSENDFKTRYTEGFLTSKDRFVNRQEAADIAMAAGQIIKETECLVSEDLY